MLLTCSRHCMHAYRKLMLCLNLLFYLSPHVRAMIQAILGFWIPRCGFRIPAQWIPDSKKRWIPIYYCFNAFLCISFSCSNLAKLKDVVTMHNKFVFLVDL